MSVLVHASPLHLEQGAATSGRAGAGTARAGAASVFYNPAAMTLSEGTLLEVGGALVTPVRLRGVRERSAPTLVTPPSVFALSTRGRLSVGVAVFSPLIHAVHWSDRDVHSDVKLMVVNPSLALRLGELSVGAGINVAGGWQEESSWGLQGPAAGAGFNAGVLAQLPGRLVVGVHYRSAMPVLVFSDPGTAASTAQCIRDPACRAYQPLGLLSTPHVVSVGMDGLPHRTLRVGVDVNASLWADARVRGPGLGVRGGVEHVLGFVAPDVKVRAGLLYDASPVRSGERNAERPWSDRVGASVGVGWQLFGVTMDAAYVADLELPAGGVDGETYSGTTHLLALSVGYRHLR
ncbi:MAG: hypothetical protein AB2A00_22895 [Myxococcota bacterium]